jgi:tryptophanyl-tRNA synthetase
MASDILLYQTDVVPVGVDQKQHVELCRDIAERVNQIYPDMFTIPEPIISTTGRKIMSLADPTKKMSKSDENTNAVVYILDDKDTIIRKFKRAVTDSETEVRFAPGKDGINNLMSIYSCFTGKTMEEIEAEFAGKGYGDFKLAVGEVCADALAPVQQKFAQLMADKGALEAQMKKGAEEASYIARRTVSKVEKKLGFVQLR